MKRTVTVVLVIGMGIGFEVARMLPESVVHAQASWQCKSWTFGLTDALGRPQANQDDAAAIGTWLGQARTVEMSSNGLEVAGRTSVVVCKQ